MILGTEIENAFTDDGVVHGHDHGRGGARIGDFRKGEHIAHGVRIGAFVLKGDHHPQQSQLGHFFQVFGGKFLGFIPFGRGFGHNLAGELADHGLNHQLFVGQLE